jgi:hypothetical protein
MKHWIMLGLAGLGAWAMPAGAEEAVSKAVWGPLADMAGHDYIGVRDGTPQTIASFHWEKPGAVLAVDGFASTGPTFKGQYSLDPATGRVVETNRRNGKLYRSDYAPIKDGFTEGGDQDGVQVRRTFRLVNRTSFVSRNESQEKGVWKVTREDGFFIQASPDWVKQLGWKSKTPPK